jgi:hypothetical protein
MNAVGTKSFSQLQYPKIVHSVLKHMFCIFSHVEGYEILQNTPKNHFGSNGVEWLHLVQDHFRNFSPPEIVHSVLKHKFCIFAHVEGLRKAPKYSQTSFWI